MYSVAQATLTNPKGQELVRRYEDTYDAQKIYQELEEYHSKSTIATQTASELLSYITSHRLGEDTWSGTTESYVVHWKDVVRQYHALIPVNQNLAEEQQLVMLQNAVHSTTELRAVKERAEHERVLNGTNLTLAQYCTLLQSACQQYNSAHRATRSRTRRVYLHDIGDQDDNPGYGESTFDIDTPVSTITAYAAQQQAEKHLPGSRMPFNIWKNLSPGDQQIWDQLSDATKVAILSGLSSSASRPSFGKGTSSRTPSSRFGSNSKGPMSTHLVNLNEISANDYLAMLHDDQGSTDDDHADDKGQQGDDELTFQDAQQGHDESSTILAHLTQREQIPPSDIHHILSTALARPKGNDTNTTAPATQLPTTSKKFGNTRKANATVTYQASTHATIPTYSVSQHESVKMDYGGLVDHGANGVVAGSNVRVISKSS
jgi:hypothetical protein